MTLSTISNICLDILLLGLLLGSVEPQICVISKVMNKYILKLLDGTFNNCVKQYEKTNLFSAKAYQFKLWT